MELGALEDAHMTSRRVPRECVLNEVKRLKVAIEEVKSVVGETAC